MRKLKQRWGIHSNFQLLLIFIVFTINGSASAQIGIFLMKCIGISNENVPVFVYYLILTLMILPIYPFLIMGVGYLFGQSIFFFKFGKNMLHKISFGLFFKS